MESSSSGLENALTEGADVDEDRAQNSGVTTSTIPPYRMILRQTPIQARSSGFNGDVRFLTPPLILQLVLADDNNNLTSPADYNQIASDTPESESRQQSTYLYSFNESNRSDQSVLSEKSSIPYLATEAYPQR
jgi:hypothetical protein